MLTSLAYTTVCRMTRLTRQVCGKIDSSPTVIPKHNKLRLVFVTMTVVLHAHAWTSSLVILVPSRLPSSISEFPGGQSFPTLSHHVYLGLQKRPGYIRHGQTWTHLTDSAGILVRHGHVGDKRKGGEGRGLAKGKVFPHRKASSSHRLIASSISLPLDQSCPYGYGVSTMAFYRRPSWRPDLPHLSWSKHA